MDKRVSTFNSILYSPNTSINRPIITNPMVQRSQTASLLMSNTVNSLSQKGRMKMGMKLPNVSTLINASRVDISGE